MSKIQELREKRAKVWEQAKTFLDDHRQDNGLIKSEDNAIYEKMEDEVMNLGKEIERLERQEAMDRELSAMISKPLASRPERMNEEKTGRASFFNVMKRVVLKTYHIAKYRYLLKPWGFLQATLQIWTKIILRQISIRETASMLQTDPI